MSRHFHVPSDRPFSDRAISRGLSAIRNTAGFSAAVLLPIWGGCVALAQTEDPVPAQSADPFVAIESRLISQSEVDEYIESLAARLLINSQDVDPFGSLQDLDAVPKIDPIAMPEMPEMPAMTTPFEEVIRRINISTVMPAERRFLIGTRSFGLNDVITLNFQGQPIRARVVEVSSRQIRFRNVETNDEASRSLDLLPAGMSAGGGSGSAIPGLIPSGPNAPIDLD